VRLVGRGKEGLEWLRRDDHEQDRHLALPHSGADLRNDRPLRPAVVQ
jgi:hypothetical protein